MKPNALFLIALLFTFCILISHAQPGGGGGLNISYITYVNGDTLDFTDKNFKINHYAMNKKFSKVEFQFLEEQKRSYYTGEKEWFYLPPDYHNNDKIEFSTNQRLEIIYKIDTMTIDFYGIMQENGAGHVEQLTTIQFFPGNYKFHLTESERFDSCWQYKDQFHDQIKKLQEDMRTGITQLTKPNLKAWRILEEAFNPYTEIFWAKYFRENCTDIVVHGPTNFTILCEYMMELTSTHFYLKTEQKPIQLNDTTAYQFYFYHVFKYHVPVINTGKDSPKNQTLPPVEEDRLAQKYLDALETHTLYVNGSRYCGKIVLNVSRNSFNPDPRHNMSQRICFNYVDGKFKYKYNIKTTPQISEDVDVRE